jgi:hypothetical protein
MKNKKIYKYVNEKDLNEEEKRTGKISYRKLIERIGKIWLFNNAPQLSEYDFEFVLNSDYNEKNDSYIEIYQYYLIDIDLYTLEKLQELKIKDLIIAWSEKLNEYVLFVDHFGTSWDYVMTDIYYTTDFEQADL